MLDKKYVTFYARSSKVRLDVGERDVVLTYVLKTLSENVTPALAFKGGTCLKKVHFGNTGRFSMDLDFTSCGMKVEELKSRLRQLLDNKTAYGIDFNILEDHVSMAPVTGGKSYIAVVKYAHSWNAGSEFELEVSYREEPVLPLQEPLLFDEMYFKFCEFPSFRVKCLQKEELLAEKLRAALQRIRGRDLYDLYLFSNRPFDKDLVKKLVVVKCWNARAPFNPGKLFGKIANADYDSDDLQQLVRRGDLPSQGTVTKTVVKEYTFLNDLDSQLLKIVQDSKAHRERQLVTRLIS
jgi:predicted nucleotidyltransferase component of viral defense system